MTALTLELRIRAATQVWKTRVTRVIEPPPKRCFRWKAWVTQPFVPVSGKLRGAASYG